MENPQKKGIIGRVREDGLPVIYALDNELPPKEIREEFGWLTVISWKYDGSQWNGMPPEETNAHMVALESAIEDRLEIEGYCRHAYSRTGNGLKELVYYIKDRDQFMSTFNTALSEYPRYPIEITFYEDPEWQDLQNIIDLFSEAH